MNENQSQIIIFSQAPADVQYVLSLYERYQSTHRISVFVMSLENIYTYYKSLNLNLKDLIFIPSPKYVPLKDLNELRKIKKKIKSDFNQYFQNFEGNTVYFFSKYFDWLTAYFVSRISIDNEVFIIDHSAETMAGSKKMYGPLTIYRKLLFKYLTSINFRFLKMQSTMMMEFPVENYHIEKTNLNLSTSTFKKYKVKTDTNKGKSVLLFENNQSNYDFYSDYEQTMVSIMEMFRKHEYKIYLKPHPRQGFSDFIKPFIECLLPSEIPGEFFNPEDFTIIAGVDTTVIACFAKEYPLRTISLLELFSFKRAEEKERFRQSQIKISNGTINFVNLLSELEIKLI